MSIYSVRSGCEECIGRLRSLQTVINNSKKISDTAISIIMSGIEQDKLLDCYKTVVSSKDYYTGGLDVMVLNITDTLKQLLSLTSDEITSKSSEEILDKLKGLKQVQRYTEQKNKVEEQASGIIVVENAGDKKVNRKTIFSFLLSVLMVVLIVFFTFLAFLML